MKGIQVCSNEGPHPFQRGDNYEIVKNTLTKLKHLLLQNHWANFNQTWHKASLCEWDLILFKEEPFNSHKGNNGVFLLLLINVMILSYVFIDLNCFLRWAMWPMGLLLHLISLLQFSFDVNCTCITCIRVNSCINLRIHGSLKNMRSYLTNLM